MKVPLTFKPGGKAAVEDGESVLNAAWQAGASVDAPCGGQGWCGRCRVRIDPPPHPSPEDLRSFSRLELRDGWRLACRAEVHVPAEISLPPRETGAAGFAPSAVSRYPSTVRKRAPRAGAYGIAVDIGTTTLAAQLWETGSRRLVASQTAVNPQSAFGSDIISRISASRRRGNLARLQSTLRKGLNDLLRGLVKDAGITAVSVASVTVAGNTTMQHFFAGEDPSPLAVAPFRTAFLAMKSRPASSLGLRSFPRATVRFVPSASAFVGGDAVAGALSLVSAGVKKPSLLIDMGTNAELVLIRKRSFAATSAAAGPALEGGALSSGMQAAPGAIEEVEFTGDLLLKTIGGRSPRGLCGSGLIDLAAILLRFGLIHQDGRLLRPEEAGSHPWKKLTARLRMIGGEPAFVLTERRGPLPRVSLTQNDVRQLQLAVSAIATAWQLLLRKSRMKTDQIQSVIIAGGFGYSLRPRNLSTIGIIAPDWEKIVSVAANSALAGAALSLLEPSSLSRAAGISKAMRTWHLAESRDFQDLFINNLGFPG
jgi:uncharacterized 2Fe-2S/4Fe-4S cluster protein (DUF4445 family)